MNPKLADYIEEGKALDVDEREIAAIALQHIDESEQVEINSSWDEEINRRVDDILSEKIQLVSGQETFELGQALLAARRNR